MFRHVDPGVGCRLWGGGEHEISPVKADWSGEADQFPGTVFDMLDDTRKLERAAEQESAGCLQLKRDAALPADREWYAERFKRAKRGVDEACGIQQMEANGQF